MPKIVEHKVNRESLINSTIVSVSKHGFEGLTVKTISEECGLNEAYIYRYFMDKTDLLNKSFIYLDNELYSKLNEFLPILDNGQDFETQSKEFFHKVWNSFFENIDKSKFYIRFIYSSYFTEELVEFHSQLNNELVDAIKGKLNPSAKLFFTMHGVFSLMLSYVNQCEMGIFENTEENIDAIYEVLNGMIINAIKQ